MFSEKKTILLVEHRDEVFARIGSDLAAAGILVHRVYRGTDASRILAQRAVDLVLISASLPDVSAWLLSKKLRMVNPEVAVWIYTPEATADDVSMANFVLADELIEYHGDLWRLSREIADCLGVSAVPGRRPGRRVPSVQALALA